MIDPQVTYIAQIPDGGPHYRAHRARNVVVAEGIRGFDHGFALKGAFHPAIGPPLIKNWKYKPTPYGESVKKALAKAAKRYRASKNGKER